MTKNSLSFAGSQILLASEYEFNSTGNFNSTETVGDVRMLGFAPILIIAVSKVYFKTESSVITTPS